MIDRLVFGGQTGADIAPGRGVETSIPLRWVESECQQESQAAI